MTDTELTEVRKAAEQIDQGAERLVRAVHAAAAAGHSLRSIAVNARRSHQTVANILKGTQS